MQAAKPYPIMRLHDGPIIATEAIRADNREAFTSRVGMKN